MDAAPISTVFENANSTSRIDRNGTLCYNTLAIAGSPYTVSTTVEMKEDLNYDPGKRWWEDTWAQISAWWRNLYGTVSSWWQGVSNEAKAAIGVGLIILSMLIACLPGGAFAEAQLAKILVNVCIGIGAAVVGWAVSSAISGNWDADELRAALANAIFFTGVTVFISTSVSTLKYVGREPNAVADLAECAGNCFIAGTLVTTVDGLKPIEDIEVGDEVLAYDPETGEQAYKPVVRLFRNTTDKWYHVHVNEQDITCTAEHPFYVADIDEFVPAKDLKAGQRVLLADGTCAVIDGILVEELDTPETTYNFEVEDFHTYYVSKDKVLVHNICEDPSKPGKLTFDDKQLGKKWGEHKLDYPNLKSHIEYRNLAEKVFSNAESVNYVMSGGRGEFRYILGHDLLRVLPNGNFISLYPL